MTAPTLGTPLQILPEGFALPPLPYLLALVAGTAVVAVGATRRDLALDARHVLAFVPWILAGSCTHVLYVVGALPPLVRPLGGTPAVYATVAVVGGLTWLAADAAVGAENGTRVDGDGDSDDDGHGRARRRGAADGTVPRVLGVAGLAGFAVTCASGIAVGLARGTLSPVWPTVALVASLVVGAAAWWSLRRAAPGVAITGRVGALAVVAHAIDGVSTAVGVDVLGFGERTPLSRVVLDAAAALPTAELLGTGWLFVLVKLAVTAVVVVFLSDLVRDEPREGLLLLGFVAAVGLGPGAHNLLLFTIAA